MPAWIVPSDTHVVGDPTGHTTDHNHVADDLTLIATAFPGVTTGAATTAHNTLDDGSGNATVTGNSVVNNPSSYANGTLVGQNAAGQYSNFNLADNVYPLDAAGHYWAFSHRTSGHVLWIFNYNGSVYLTAVTLDETGNMTVAGNVAVGTAGSGLRVKEGSNAKQGTATLTAGSAVVSNTSVTASSRIFLTSNADGGTPGWLRVSARSAGTSFTITSSSGTDTSTVAYEIFEPA
jgi:hypothetical protein